MTKRFSHAIVAVGLLVVLTPASVAVQDGRQAQPGSQEPARADVRVEAAAAIRSRGSRASRR